MTLSANETTNAGISVSWDDLSSFHAQHFQSDQQALAQSEDQLVKDDGAGLGYYYDGVERTLTDEQIAMFRHSELQQLIKAHRLQLEHEEYLGIHKPTQPQQTALQTLQNTMKPDIDEAQDAHPKLATSGSSEEEDRNRGQKDNLARKRQKLFYKPQKQDKEQFIGTSDERTFRRVCREADDFKDSTVELDY